MISIIIPVQKIKKTINPKYFYKKVFGIKETITSIVNTIGDLKFEFVFIQNGKNEELTNYLEQILQKYPGRLILISDTIGVARAWNIGISGSKYDILAVCNDDVEFKDNSSWLKLLNALKPENVGEVGPEGGLWDYDKGGKRLGIDCNDEVEEISGYFFITKREAFKIVGGFDEFYTPASFEEIDYSFKIREAGFKCLVVANTGIIHHGNHGISSKQVDINYLGNQTINTTQLHQKNRSYFIRKWFKNE